MLSLPSSVSDLPIGSSLDFLIHVAILFNRSNKVYRGSARKPHSRTRRRNETAAAIFFSRARSHVASMQSLQERASAASGVPLGEAFSLDEANLYGRLGRETFVALSTNFYTRVYEDPDEWFREIFANSTKDDAIRNQYEFFIQRMGGPPLYSQRKGHPALIGRHGPYSVTLRSAERWLSHMEAALEETKGIDEDSRERMSKFFRHTAYFLVAGKELVNRERVVGYAGKHQGGA